jgi:DNA/RNA endonuclease YhcR with UshA esterase domain
MRRPPLVLAMALAVLCIAGRATAYHSWAADYDGSKPVAVKGVVTKVEWTNPHTHVYVDSTDGNGTVTRWNFEMASTLALERGGWSRKTLNVGDKVSIEGFGGRSEITRAIVTSITTADGRELFVARPGN